MGMNNPKYNFRRMPWLDHLEFKGMIHHVLARGNRKVDIFTTDRDREKYIELIKI